jgi:uncharacterized membrane protein
MNTIIFIYFCIGFIFSIFYSSKIDDIDDKDNESGMVNLYLLFITFVWPYYLIKYILTHK